MRMKVIMSFTRDSKTKSIFFGKHLAMLITQADGVQMSRVTLFHTFAKAAGGEMVEFVQDIPNALYTNDLYNLYKEMQIRMWREYSENRKAMYNYHCDKAAKYSL